MEKRGLASRIMRIVSVLGIICLLALQWVWWRNAYRAVELDFMKNAQECLSQSFDKVFTQSMDGKSKKMKVMRESDFPQKLNKKITKHSANNTSEIPFLIEELLALENNPITPEQVDKQYSACLKEKFDIIPTHDLKLVKTSSVIDSINKPRFNRISIGNSRDTIYHQYGFMSYAVVVLPSPIALYIKQGAFILIVSVLLMLLIGGILILQFINMQRDRKFAEFIKDYTRMIAHDLRTPVTGIQMIFQMLKKSLTSEGNEKLISDGVNLSKKILLNLDNILYVAKSEQKDLAIHRTNVDMRTFMDNVLKMYRERDYNPKVVSIETRYNPGSFSCNMDVDLMEKVIENLMENAIKYTSQEAKILLTCKYENDVVEIRVRDNGIGMPDEDQKRVFELFERGSTNDQNHFPGFGIGLYFVQRAVKAHGGKVTVKSEVNKGTEFIIKFIS